LLTFLVSLKVGRNFDINILSILAKVWGDKEFVEAIVQAEVCYSKPITPKSLRRPFAVPTFEDLIETVTDETILPFSKLSAISALGRLGNKEAVPYLVEALQSENHYVRRESARALGMLGISEAVEPLIEAVDMDKDNEVRRNAIVALGQLGDEQAVDILTQAMEESSFLIKRAAEASLKQIRGERRDTPGEYSTPTTPITQRTGTEMPSTRYTTARQPEVRQTVSRTPVARRVGGTTAPTERGEAAPPEKKLRPRRDEYTQSGAAPSTEQYESSEDVEISAADIARHQRRVRRTRSVPASEVEETQDAQPEPESETEQWEDDEMEPSTEDIAQHQQRVGRTAIPLPSEAEETQDVQLEPESATEQWEVDEDDSTEPDADILIRDSTAKQAETYETPPSSYGEATQAQRTTGYEAGTQTRVYDDNTYVQVRTRTPSEEPPPQQTQKRANWKCKNCGEVISGDFRDCWNCGANKNGGESVDYDESESVLVESDINIISCPQCDAEMLEGVLFTGENELTFNYRKNNQTNDVVIDKDAVGRVCLKCHLIFLKF